MHDQMCFISDGEGSGLGKSVEVATGALGLLHQETVVWPMDLGELIATECGGKGTVSHLRLS